MTSSVAQKPEIIVIGCGFVGREVARQAAVTGSSALVTTRDRGRAGQLRVEGLAVHLLDGDEAWERLLARATGSNCVITYPPEPNADRWASDIAGRAHASVYISSTGVYGDTTGEIDDATPAAPSTERGLRRLASERRMREGGAVVLRAPGIYGPGRGLHIRLRAGTFKMTGDGTSYLSRIHVADLAGLALAALARGRPGTVHVVGDLMPSTQQQLVAFLCDRLGLPMPEQAERARAHETLRSDRRIDPRPALSALGYTLRYADYRDGYGGLLNLLASG